MPIPVLKMKGIYFSATEILNLVKETLTLLGDKKTFFCVTIPGEISISEQIELARKLEYLGIDLIQAEGHYPSNKHIEGTRGLLNRAELSISNTIELTRNIDIPVITSNGINPTTAPFAVI